MRTYYHCIISIKIDLCTLIYCNSYYIPCYKEPSTDPKHISWLERFQSYDRATRVSWSIRWTTTAAIPKVLLESGLPHSPVAAPGATLPKWRMSNNCKWWAVREARHAGGRRNRVSLFDRCQGWHCRLYKAAAATRGRDGFPTWPLPDPRAKPIRLPYPVSYHLFSLVFGLTLGEK